MTIEERLQELILERYHSMREFSIAIDIPNTTMFSILKRGIGNSSVSNIIKICKALGISADALADGEIVSYQKQTTSKAIDTIEVKELLEDTKEVLSSCGFVTLDGKPINKHDVESIIDAMDVGVELAKKRHNS